MTAKSTLSTPFEAWPEKHQERWINALSTVEYADEFSSDEEEKIEWANSTKESVMLVYSMFLYSMHEVGRTDAVTSDNLRHYVSECMARGLRTSTIALHVGKLNSAMKVLEPSMNRQWLKMSYRNLKHRSIHEGKRKHGRIVDPAELLRLGKDMINEAQQRKLTLRSAILHRNGSMLCLLATAPVRLRNFTLTTIGEHLDLNNGTLSYSPNETKEQRQDLRELPDEITAILLDHVMVYRPQILQSHVHDQLWISRYGTPLTSDAISTKIGNITQQALGVRVSPHMFRDCAATVIKEQYPEKNAVATALLNHSSSDITRIYQEEARVSSAQKKAQKVLAISFENLNQKND